MNDPSNVSIPDTLAVLFAESRKGFEQILQENNLLARLAVWKFIYRIYEVNPIMIFFQSSNISLWFEKYMIKELTVNSHSV